MKSNFVNYIFNIFTILPNIKGLLKLPPQIINNEIIIQSFLINNDFHVDNLPEVMELCKGLDVYMVSYELLCEMTKEGKEIIETIYNAYKIEKNDMVTSIIPTANDIQGIVKYATKYTELNEYIKNSNNSLMISMN